MRAAFFILLISTIVVIGCSRSFSQNPVAPAQPASMSPVNDNRHSWGIWDVLIDADHRSAEIVPLRGAEMHLNAVNLLETAPCKTCLTIGNIKITGPNQLQADITLIHPFPGLVKYTGFDVRGIFITQADFTFPSSGRKIALGDGVPRMLNPDGYTPLFNPTEFPPISPALFGYIAGKHATGGDLSANLNPFMAYRKDAPRRMFEAGGSETRTVQIYAPTGPIHFGYAVDACWYPAENVVDPVKDFPLSANCLEAYGISVAMPYSLPPFAGSTVPVEVTVFDHQGSDTISSVTVEAPDVFPGELTLSYSSSVGIDESLFTGTLTNQLGAGNGEYPILVRVCDTHADPHLGEIDAWQVEKMEVGLTKGWARTWGGPGDDHGYSVAVDNSGNVFVTGSFWDTVDFDPGPGVDNHSSDGPDNIFLSKFDSSGNFVWARTWGGKWPDRGYSVAVDGSGNAYVTGVFDFTADFDPGPGVDNHTSNGDWDVS